MGTKKAHNRQQKSPLTQLRCPLFASKFQVACRWALVLLSVITIPAFAQSGLPILNMLEDGQGGTKYSLTLQLLALMTVLTLLPSLLMMTTSFVRIIIVMSLLRQALGTGQTPPNQVLVGISLFLTLFIMAPTFNAAYEDAISPYLEEQISFDDAVLKTEAPFRTFMLNQTRETDIAMFAEIARHENLDSSADVPFTTLVPAFITSELKSAFAIGFLIYIPFVVIDLVVASVLMSMGMMMLSPMMISMPFKLMLFVLVDGWSLIMGSLTASFAIS